MTDDARARGRAYFPPAAADLLRARTLAADYPHLAGELRSGQDMLDVGCGTGAITAGMAAAVLPGRAVGIDANRALLDEAVKSYGRVPNLSFQEADLYALSPSSAYDVVVAARVLQWLDRPAQAVQALTRALKPGGRLFLLDDNHHKVRHSPPPPAAMQHFRARYLDWRSDAGMDNEAADHLSEWMQAAGLQEVRVVPQEETTRRGDADFERRIRLWGAVAATRGQQVVQAGYLTEAERQAAVEAFRHWADREAQAQTFVLKSAVGTRPA